MPTLTDDELIAASRNYRPPSTIDTPPPDPEQTGASARPWEDPSNLKAAEMGRHYDEETQDPLGAAGERGTPIEQVDPQDAALIQASKNYAISKGDVQQEGVRTLVKSAVEGLQQIGTYPMQALSAATNFLAKVTGEPDTPSLTGLSVDQVAAARDQMVAKKANLDKTIDGIINSGQPEAAESVVGLTTQSANIQKRIDEANGIISSGQAKFTPDQPYTALGAAGSFLRSRASQTGPITQEALNAAAPTTEEFANSQAGKILSGIGQLPALAVAGAVAPESAIPLMAGLMGGQTYDDAKAHGASDDVAENASLLAGITTLAAAPVMETGVAALANKWAGMTSKQVIAQLVEAGTHVAGSGAEMGVYQLQNNAIALLSGYDPNRPLTEGVLGQVLFGSALSGLTQVIGKAGIPALSRLVRPADTTVRNAPATPAETGPTTEPEPSTVPPAAPSVPQGTEAAPPAAPAEPEATATAEVRQNAGAPPEQVLANTGEPEDKVAQFHQLVETLGPQQPEAAPAPAVPEAEARPAEAEPASQLANAHQEIAQQMEELMRQESAQPQPLGHTEAARTEAPAEPVPATMAPTPEQAAAAVTPATTAAAPETGFKVPRQPAKSQVLTPENRARWETWDSLSTKEQRALRANDPAAIEKFNRNWAEQLAANEANKPWYESDEFASQRGGAAPARPDQPVTPRDVKRITNDAGTKMGIDRYVHYVPTTESLPDRIKNTLTEGERNKTAQIVRDNGTKDLYIIGDRFHSSDELHRALIEETLPHLYRDVSDMRVVHDPTDSRLGYYDIESDRPVLNTDALLRTDDPFGHASKTAIEEIDVHQGFTKLLGPRNGKAYVDAMNSVQRNFDRLKLNDILAQRKGYADLAEMAKAYGYEDYASNPRSQHALTEELIGSYAQGFRDRATLERNSPAWYQTALRSLNNAIRGRLGLELQDIDIQHLLADSASALRYPKYTQEGMFHPEIDAQAKDDMAKYQLANRRPEEGEAGGEPEHADIGSEIIKSRVTALQRGLDPNEFLRQQPVKLAFDTSRSFRERMGFLNDASGVVETRASNAQAMHMAQDIFDRDLGGNVNTAMDDLLQWNRETGAVNPALTEIISRETDKQIKAMTANGYGEQAKLLEARLDRFNREVAPHVTGVARELQAQRLRTATGQSVAAEYKVDVNDSQSDFINRKRNGEANRQVKNGLNKVEGVTKDAAGKLRDDTKGALDNLQKRLYRWGTTKSLPEQYTEDLVKRIDDALNKVAGKAIERAPLENIFDTFRKNIQQIVKEQVDIPAQPRPPKPAAIDTLRQVMTNYPAYEEAWRRTVDQLQTTNPPLFEALNRAIAEPVGKELANKLAAEQDTNLSDLIYKHFSTANRINEDLANKIAVATGLSGADSTKLSDALQKHFTDIVKTKQADRLQQILNAVQTAKNARPAKGELAQLIDHVAIGSLDSKEWLNTVAPRFGLTSYTPESIAALKESGDLMMRMRDEGLSNSAIAQAVRQKISNLTDTATTPFQRNSRYVQSVYTAGLLTGPLTHAPYWFQNAFVGGLDSIIRGMNVIAKTGDLTLPLQMFNDFWGGIMRGAQEWLPTLKEGFAQAETPSWEGNIGEKMIGSNPLEQMKVTANPLTWGGQYKYVRHVLEAMSNLISRGTEYAMLRANYTELAYERGMSGPEAWKYAEQGVYGSSDQQVRAQSDAQRYAQEFNLSKSATTMLENELLDRYKTRTEADDPDTILGDEERLQREDVARRALAAGTRSTLKGEVGGFAGGLSRKLVALGQDYPPLRFAIPFMKVPFNLVNELAAWTPVGIARGWNVGMTEKYLEKIPGMEARIKSGNMSEAQIEELRMNQLVKGIAGTVLASSLGVYINQQIGNPNPFVRFTYTGPQSYGQQQIEQAKGWQPNSLKIGDHWFSYENTPFRSLFAALGAFEDFRRYGKQYDDPGSVAGWSAYHVLHGAISSVFGSPLQGLTSLFDFTNKQGGPNIERTIGNFLSQVVAAVPSTLIGGTGTRQLYRAFVPQEYEAPDYISKLYRNIPVVNTMFLKPKLNVLGEPLNRNPINNAPIIPTNVPDDPVWQFLAHHDNLRLAMPGNDGKVDGVKMTPQEVYQNHLARGPALKAMLADAIRDPDFVNSSVDDQNTQIKAFEAEAKLSGDEAVRDYREKHHNPNEVEEEQ